MKKYVFGVDVGGTTVKMGLFDMNANVLEKWEIPSVTANGGERVLPDIAASIEEKMGKYEIEQDEVAGVGIGVPGPVDAGRHRIQDRKLRLGYRIQYSGSLPEALRCTRYGRKRR